VVTLLLGCVCQEGANAGEFTRGRGGTKPVTASIGEERAQVCCAEAK
jgi:hypothetical protein